MKTRLITLILFFTLCHISLFAQETRLTVDLSQYFKNRKISLIGPDFKEVLSCDSLGKKTVALNLKEGAYFTMNIDFSSNRLYLEPGKDLTVTVVRGEDGKFNLMNLDLRFDGVNAAANAYLNTCELGMMKDEDFLLDEKTCIRKVEKLLKQNEKAIKNYKLEKEFEKKELMQARYKILEWISRYPVQHFWKGGNQASVLYNYDDTPIVKEYISKQLIDDESAWQIPSYRVFVNSAIGILPAIDFSLPWEVKIQKRLEVLTQYFQSPRILEDVTQKMMLAYIERTEGDSLKSLQSFYDKFVTKPEYRQELERQYVVWKGLKRGEKIASSESAYQDIEGNPVRLEDLKGKYIYIDVWATWCGPCRGEIPSLKKLEEEFQGKNIHFVSISIDNRRSDWVKMVERDKLGGVQLWGGPNAQIAIDYKIKGIPRFMLLDREGKVIDKDMTRPSDPRTKERLEMLEGI